MNLCGVGFGVGTEELRIQLREDVSNAVSFVRELDAEQCLEEGEELGGYLRLESGHVGESQKQADGLRFVSKLT